MPKSQKVAAAGGIYNNKQITQKIDGFLRGSVIPRCCSGQSAPAATLAVT